jgi:hypothetical protein
LFYKTEHVLTYCKQTQIKSKKNPGLILSKTHKFSYSIYRPCRKWDLWNDNKLEDYVEFCNKRGHISNQSMFEIVTEHLYNPTQCAVSASLMTN